VVAEFVKMRLYYKLKQGKLTMRSKKPVEYAQNVHLEIPRKMVGD